MATVTITIEDIEKGGEAGLRFSAVSDPKFPEDEDEMTIAQKWSIEIVNLIVSNATEVTMKDPVSDKH